MMAKEQSIIWLTVEGCIRGSIPLGAGKSTLIRRLGRRDDVIGVRGIQYRSVVAFLAGISPTRGNRSIIVNDKTMMDEVSDLERERGSSWNVLPTTQRWHGSPCRWAYWDL